MRDILLSSKKQGRFEEMIERELRDEFGSETYVTVQSDGKVFIRATGTQYKTPPVLLNHGDEVYDALSSLDFSFESSPYTITDGAEDDELIGAVFYIQRDGW